MYKSRFIVMKIEEDKIPDLIREQKDKQVISHLYKVLLPTVQSFIRKNNGIVDDAHDVFQDAILHFYKQVADNSFNGEKYTVYGYIYKLAIYRWINKINKDKRMVFNTDASAELAREAESYQIAESGDGQSRNIITRFVSYIGAQCVELLTYRIYGNLMFEDITIRMGFNSEAAAKMRFKRCREKMVEVIKNNPALAEQLRRI